MRVFGEVTAVMPTKKGVSKRSGQEWASQDFVVKYKEVEGQYKPDTMMVNLFGGYTIEKNALKPGDMVDLYVEHEAEEYQGRWYNKIKVIQIKKVVQEEQPQEQQPVEFADESQVEALSQEERMKDVVEEAKENDLPF